jgi:hypothetical protein
MAVDQSAAVFRVVEALDGRRVNPVGVAVDKGDRA